MQCVFNPEQLDKKNAKTLDGFLLARKFWERTLSKLPKSVQNRSKALKTPGTGPYSGRDGRVRFS